MNRIPAFAFAEGDDGGIVYGSEFGLSVSAPEGWTFDSKSGAPQGLQAVMYPKGSTWPKANIVMHVTIFLSTDSSLEAFIAADIDRMRKSSPGIVVEKAEPISIAGASSAEVRLYSGDRWGNHEYIAYASKGRGVAIYVLSSRDRESVFGSIEVFRDMVSKSIIMNVKTRR